MQCRMSCQRLIVLLLVWMSMVMMAVAAETLAPPNYGEALKKSILFFEGQRSGKLPTNQRLNWRKDSGLTDGSDKSVDLVGGYYDAGDNVKFNFPMAFSTTMLAWSVLEFGKSMTTSDTRHALDAIKWSTDYLLKATSQPDVVFAQVGEPNGDHNCWERPEDMDTPRTSFAVTKDSPGSEVSAEIAAAFAASSMVFKHFDIAYSKLLLQRALKVFKFADTYRGSYNDGVGKWVCPFYCDYSGYQDELIWGAAWLYKATGASLYWNYVNYNFNNFLGDPYGGKFAEFGWDTKHAGINILLSKFVLKNKLESSPFLPYADHFVCNVLPESPNNTVAYSPGGLVYRSGGCNMQHTTALSFLLLTYSRYLKSANRVIQCGSSTVVTPSRLVEFARIQVDYILGKNPMNMSYMVGYGKKFPRRIHHRASSLPNVDRHPERIKCKDGTPYFLSENSNPNLLIGAVVGGPDLSDLFADYRGDATYSEPTTYVNAPLVGLLAYFKGHS